MEFKPLELRLTKKETKTLVRNWTLYHIWLQAVVVGGAGKEETNLEDK